MGALPTSLLTVPLFTVEKAQKEGGVGGLVDEQHFRAAFKRPDEEAEPTPALLRELCLIADQEKEDDYVVYLLIAALRRAVFRR